MWMDAEKTNVNSQELHTDGALSIRFSLPILNPCFLLSVITRAKFFANLLKTNQLYYANASHVQELNSYLAFLFEMIVKRGPSAGLNVSLSRYDLFHGHLFLATDSGRLGIL